MFIWGFLLGGGMPFPMNASKPDLRHGVNRKGKRPLHFYDGRNKKPAEAGFCRQLKSVQN
jgi:hypothetical protein